MGNILKNGIDFGGVGMGKLIKNGVEFSGGTVIVEKPSMLFDDGQWYNTDKIALNTVGGEIVGKKLVFTHTDSTQDALGIATESVGIDKDYAIKVTIKNTGSINISLQYGYSSEGFDVDDIVMQGQGRGQWFADTLAPGTTKGYILKNAGTGTYNGIFFGLYNYGEFSFEIETIPFLYLN